MSQLLKFRVGDSAFALPAELVTEVIEGGAKIYPFPLANERLVGIAQVRERWVPVIDCPHVWGDARRTSVDAAAPILIVLGKGRPRLGIPVDDLGEVIEIDLQQAVRGQASEPLFDIDGEIVRYLDPSVLLAEHERLLGEEGGTMVETEAVEESIQVVELRIGPGQFAVDVMTVSEIARVPEIQAVPDSPEFIEGLADMRKGVIPVLDMRKRFGGSGAQTTSTARVVVLRTKHGPVGLIVDEVPGVIRIPAGGVSAAPKFLEGLAGRFVKGTARCEGRLVVLIDVDELLSSKERVALEDLLTGLKEDVSDEKAGRATKKKPKRSTRRKKK